MSVVQPAESAGMHRVPAPAKLLAAAIAAASLACHGPARAALVGGVEDNRSQISTLRVGMSLDEVRQALGPGVEFQGRYVLRNPYESESRVLESGETRTVLYYQTEYASFILDEHLTPIVFVDDKLVGWGWALVSTAERRVSRGIHPDRETPQRPGEDSDVASGTTASGSGFIVGVDGYVLTCAHVVEGARAITVRDSTGVQHVGRILASDVKNDASLLRVATLVQPGLPLAGSSREIGQDVFVLGYPLQSDLRSRRPVITTGVVASGEGIDGDSRHLQVTAAVNSGNSGGPVLDRRGNVIAMASHRLGDLYGVATQGQVPQGVNFGIKAELLRVIVEGAGVPLPDGPTDREYTASELFERCADAVVHIEAHR